MLRGTKRLIDKTCLSVPFASEDPFRMTRVSDSTYFLSVIYRL